MREGKEELKEQMVKIRKEQTEKLKKLWSVVFVQVAYLQHEGYYNNTHEKGGCFEKLKVQVHWTPHYPPNDHTERDLQIEPHCNNKYRVTHRITNKSSMNNGHEWYRLKYMHRERET